MIALLSKLKGKMCELAHQLYFNLEEIAYKNAFCFILCFSQHFLPLYLILKNSSIGGILTKMDDQMKLRIFCAPWLPVSLLNWFYWIAFFE